MIILLHEIKKRSHSRWFMWDELFAGYYLLIKDKDGNLPYHMFSRL